eukprot:COSAG06_NODE_22221_length_730_cov_1.296355_2_plen_102_part_01
MFSGPNADERMRRYRAQRERDLASRGKDVGGAGFSHSVSNFFSGGNFSGNIHDVSAGSADKPWSPMGGESDQDQSRRISAIVAYLQDTVDPLLPRGGSLHKK